MNSQLPIIVKTYQADVSELLQESRLEQILANLPPHRRLKAESYRFAKDRALCAGARLLLEYAMAMEGISLNCAQLQYNSQGKPYLTGAPHFNLSHSGTMVLCAISQQAEVGCDVQEIQPWNEKLVRACMQKDESDPMFRLVSVDQQQATHLFFRHWTLKESYMKAIGAGLSLPPDSFAVVLSRQDNPRFCDAHPTKPCKCTEFFLNDGYCYAVCVLDPNAEFEPITRVFLDREILKK